MRKAKFEPKKILKHLCYQANNLCSGLKRPEYVLVYRSSDNIVLTPFAQIALDRGQGGTVSEVVGCPVFCAPVDACAHARGFFLKSAQVLHCK